MAGGETPVVREAILRDALKTTKEALRVLRGEIQRTKFSVLLAKSWFDEFESREDNTLVIDGVTFTVSLREKKVDV
jgi:hypothetical protein